MATQLKLHDNFGTININSGRPTKNHKESLGAPFSIRVYEAEKEKIKERMYQYNLNRNEVVLKCLQVGLENFELLDWISNNTELIAFMAKNYHKKMTER